MKKLKVLCTIFLILYSVGESELSPGEYTNSEIVIVFDNLAFSLRDSPRLPRQLKKTTYSCFVSVASSP